MKKFTKIWAAATSQNVMLAAPNLLTLGFFVFASSVAAQTSDPAFHAADAICRRKASAGGGIATYRACMQQHGFVPKSKQNAPHPTGAPPAPSMHDPVSSLGRPASDETQAMIAQADKLVAAAYERAGKPVGYGPAYTAFYNDPDRSKAIGMFLQAGEAGDDRGVIGWCVQTWGRIEDAQTGRDIVQNCIADRALYDPAKVREQHEQAITASALPPAAQVLTTRLQAGETVKLACAPTDEKGKDYRGKPIMPSEDDLFSITLNTVKGVVDLGTTKPLPMIKPVSRGHYENGADGADHPIGMDDGSWGHKETVTVDYQGMRHEVIRFSHENYRSGSLIGGGNGGTFDIRTQALQFGAGYIRTHAYCAVSPKDALAGAISQMEAAQ